MTHVKLQKLYYLLQKKEYIKNAVIFKEGDPIDGIYFIDEGQLEYQQKSEILKVDESKSRWINSKMLKNGQNKVIDNRTIVEFSVNEIVGFEEVLRSHILEADKKAWIEDPANKMVFNREAVI